MDLGELVLVDSGAGMGFAHMVSNVAALNLDPKDISTVILTHCHLDHMGGAALFRSRFGSRIVMHELDAGFMEKGDQHMTAAFCFGIHFMPFSVDRKLAGEQGRLRFVDHTVSWLHTPGHTPGSIAVYIDTPEKRILFGQDISAPLLEEFSCDPAAWRKSMDKLLALEADILCDGHAGVYRPKGRVRAYIERSIEAHGFEL
jgi:glyoxylase-like metal-dependent hydrolase (beta-lactamase superfamily II)